jgi:5-methylcytosine-specific restriction endonuclease McrA
MPAPELKTAAWQRLRAEILATHPPVCHICGEHIDLSLPGTVSRGPTVDHVKARGKGGARWDRRNLRPAHKGCNSAKRDRDMQHRPQSRTW